MIKGVLLAESLRLDVAVEVPGVVLRKIRREDVSGSTSPEQPSIWTFVDFEAPDAAADELAAAFAAALLPGWYADFSVGGDHVVVFAGAVFRYRKGNHEGRGAAQAHGRRVGVPEYQLDWPD